MPKVGIAGVGVVGGALKKYFEKKKYQVFLYDKKGLGSIKELEKADYIYLCLPTPYMEGVGCDIHIVEEVIARIKKPKVIIIKSTVSPGTTELLQKEFPRHKLLMNPEFLTEVTSTEDMMHPDKQIVGYTALSYHVAGEVLKQLPSAPYEKLVPATVAEFIKYGCNTWFATKVAKNNELYDLATAYGVREEDFLSIIDGMKADKMVGDSHLAIYHKGKRGYWGKCLPKDTKALLELAKHKNVAMPVLQSVNDYNDKLLNSQDMKTYI